MPSEWSSRGAGWLVICRYGDVAEGQQYRTWRRTLSRPRRGPLYGPGRWRIDRSRWRSVHWPGRWRIDRSRWRSVHWSGRWALDGSRWRSVHWSGRRALDGSRWRSVHWSGRRALDRSEPRFLSQQSSAARRVPQGARKPWTCRCRWNAPGRLENVAVRRECRRGCKCTPLAVALRCTALVREALAG